MADWSSVSEVTYLLIQVFKVSTVVPSKRIALPYSNEFSFKVNYLTFHKYGNFYLLT